MIVSRAALTFCLMLPLSVKAQSAAPDISEPAAAAPATATCGHMVLHSGFTISPPADIDSGAVDKARQLIWMFPVDQLSQTMFAKLKTDIDAHAASAPTRKDKEAIRRVQADLPSIASTFLDDVIQIVASAYACHQPQPDLDAAVAFMKSEAGQKIIAAAQIHQKALLNSDENNVARDFMNSPAGRHMASIFSEASPARGWVNAEIHRLLLHVVERLAAKYEVSPQVHGK